MNFSEKKYITDGQTSRKSKKIVANFFLQAWEVNMVINTKREFISPGRSRTPTASEMKFFVTVI